jgi:hypothetical protein
MRTLARLWCFWVAINATIVGLDSETPNETQGN